MSLLGALSTGTSALAVDQAALQVTGNNVANAGNPDYTRQVVGQAPALEQLLKPGAFVGTGVTLTTVTRQIDDALNERLRGAVSDSTAASTTSTWVGQLETTLNALSGSDLSAQLTKFFGGWSTLANDPTNVGQRQVVVQDGVGIANYLNGLDKQLAGLRDNIDQEVPGQIKAADGLATQIAQLNVQIVTAEGGSNGTANGLRDQRDAALKQLAQLVNINTIQQPNGSVTVYVGSQPLVDGETNNGLQLKTTTAADGSQTQSLAFKVNGGNIDPTAGELAALTSSRQTIVDTMAQVDQIGHSLIQQVNAVHASGQGLVGVTSVTATNQVLDPTKALASTAAGLSYPPTNGSFVVHVTDSAGVSHSTLVQVNATGGAGDTTLNSLAASLNGVGGVTATVAGGKLTIAAAAPSDKVSFSQDSSGVLAGLGIGTFFSGSTAGDIAVTTAVVSDPNQVAAAANGRPGDNTNALAISKLETTAVAALGGVSLKDAYDNVVNTVGNSAAAAKTQSEAAQTVQDSLTAQQQSIGGVSIDEETVNLMKYQRAYQAAARVVSTVDQMIQTLLQISI